MRRFGPDLLRQNELKKIASDTIAGNSGQGVDGPGSYLTFGGPEAIEDVFHNFFDQR